MKRLVRFILDKIGYSVKKIQWNNDLDVLKISRSKVAPVVFDIGANVGNYSRKVISANPNTKIFAFEPYIETYNTLVQNTNNQPNIKCECIALSNFDGDAFFNINKSSETNSLLDKFENVNKHLERGMDTLAKVKVKTQKLDTYIKAHDINEIELLKLDVQGSELLILLGASEALAQKKIKYIRLEVLFRKLYKDQSLFQDVFAFLDSHDYKFQGFIDTTYIDGKLHWADAFFISN